MLNAFTLAIADVFAPALRRALLLSLALAIVLLVLLWFGAAALLVGLHVSGIGWLDDTIDVFGSLGALVLAWLLFPAATMLVLGFFLDGAVTDIERMHYPELPSARRIGAGEALACGLRFALVALVVNLIALPLYLVPGANLVVYYGANGYLVGRQYFELVALRRAAAPDVRSQWRAHRGALLAAGIVIAFLLTLPFIDLAAPLVGAAAMVHLAARLRRR